jgi:hypothetical protein
LLGLAQSAVALLVPLLLSVAYPPPSVYALLAFPWKPLLSPLPLVTAALADGPIHPVLAGPGERVGVSVRVGVAVLVCVAEGTALGGDVGVAEGTGLAGDVGVFVAPPG